MGGRRLRAIAATVAAGCIWAAAAGLVARADASIWQSPGISPPGANDFSCRPTAAHPEPVVLVHGTFGDMTISWNEVSPALHAQGYCVFALDLPRRATAPVEQSASVLAGFVDRVLAATGASRVSIVGHSQGGMLPRYYVRFLGGLTRVARIVGLAPSNHGTTNPLAPPAGSYLDCPACTEQVAGSAFLQQLNSGDQTPGDIAYTVVETAHDEVVTPYTSAFLPAGPKVTNVTLQLRCPLDPVEHVGIIYDPAALRWVEDALARRGPADPGLRPDCGPL